MLRTKKQIIPIKPFQLSLLPDFDKPIIKLETLWQRMNDLIKNLKYLKTKVSFSEHTELQKTILISELILIGNRIGIVQFKLNPMTLRHRHDKMADYTDKMADKVSLNMNYCPEYDNMADHMQNCHNTLVGIVVANKQLLHEDLKDTVIKSRDLTLKMHSYVI